MTDSDTGVTVDSWTPRTSSDKRTYQVTMGTFDWQIACSMTEQREKQSKAEARWFLQSPERGAWLYVLAGGVYVKELCLAHIR